jgi:hypothetical protein
VTKKSNIPGLPGWNWAATAWAVYWLLVAVLAILAYCQVAFWHFKVEGWLGQHLTMLPFTVGLLAFVGAMLWLPWLIDRRRTNALALLANDLDMKFTARPTSDEVAAFSKLSLFQLGAATSLRNLMVGQFNEADVLMVDYFCRVGPWSRSPWPASNRAHRSKTTVVIFPNAAADVPDFTLTPRMGLKSQASVINLMLKSYPDLKVGQQPAHPFASSYWVGGNDGKAIGEVFTPQVMDFFAEHKNWNVEVHEGHMVVYKLDRLVKANRCPKRLENALSVSKVLTQRPAAQAGPFKGQDTPASESSMLSLDDERWELPWARKTWDEKK